MNFQTILMPKVNLAKMLSEKSWSVRTILILSMLFVVTKSKKTQKREANANIAFSKFIQSGASP